MTHSSSGQATADMTDPAQQVQELTERMARLEEELMRAQRLSSVGALASSITHEFNNILTTVINYAKMGLRHPDEATRTKAARPHPHSIAASCEDHHRHAVLCPQYFQPD